MEKEKKPRGPLKRPRVRPTPTNPDIRTGYDDIGAEIGRTGRAMRIARQQGRAAFIFDVAGVPTAFVTGIIAHLKELEAESLAEHRAARADQHAAAE